ncbi:MAG: hypothetical protein FD118_4219, partial [Rhodocyclaceae bacterium]
MSYLENSWKIDTIIQKYAHIVDRHKKIIGTRLRSPNNQLLEVP